MAVRLDPIVTSNSEEMWQGTMMPMQRIPQWVKMSRATHFVGTADLPQ
jgi:hypothetical protein